MGTLVKYCLCEKSSSAIFSFSPSLLGFPDEVALRQRRRNLMLYLLKKSHHRKVK